MTKALLSRRGVEFDVRDIEADPAALDELQVLGLMSVPVVVLFLVLQRHFVRALTEGAVKH